LSARPRRVGENLRDDARGRVSRGRVVQSLLAAARSYVRRSRRLSCRARTGRVGDQLPLEQRRRMAQAPPPQQEPNWDLYRALREQWTHEDNLVNHRLMWLILSEGLLFTAYGTVSTAKLHWLAYGFPFFGMT